MSIDLVLDGWMAALVVATVCEGIALVWVLRQVRARTHQANPHWTEEGKGPQRW